MGKKIDRKKKKEYLSVPIQSIDLEKVDSIADLVDAFSKASIQSRAMAECVDVYRQMLEDKEVTIMVGITGALIAGGLRKVIRDMVEHRLVDVLVSTGAILYQDTYQARGYKHYMGHPAMDDVELRDLFIDRIYDTLVDEEKFEETDTWYGKLAEKLEPRGYSTREFFEFVASHLKDDHSIIKTAAKQGVPIFCPALNDSSIGIGLTKYYTKYHARKRMYIDPIRDNFEITQVVCNSPRTAAIYIGGGVPKNWINDSIIMALYASGLEREGHAYAFQITADAPHWGGLSGSTLKEAQSWGKIARRSTKATCYVETTIGLPLIVGAVLQKGYARGREPPEFEWEGDRVKITR
jgi:deoxyhypusine synthase